MTVSSVQSGYSLINQSQNLAKEAATEIARQPEPDNTKALEFNKIDYEAKEQEVVREERNNTSDIDSLNKLNQASTYNQAGANVVQRSNEIIGTLLDTHV
ncbi:hypothetical protein L3Q72_15190 [Vibrio sp. JC009]|uniref:hypothetical protein n=1 Tax=Vibrio sp. JC009 TaxID=2912314 RepID=UPI0023B11755|nr:hypothetical protein [Vibrio sp. JC009]WED24226.1 hypothetical protein L3Q72_15190 [Vibrio sp. JC009]